MNYGSANQNNYRGSGIESKQATRSYKGSVNYGSMATNQHGSIAMHHHGSIAMQKHGSSITQKHGSTDMRKHVSHSPQKGSYRYNSERYGLERYGSGTHVSGTHGGSNRKYMSAYVFSAIKGSGTHTKNRDSNKYSSPSPNYYIFAPTFKPSEKIIPTYALRLPTFQPTASMTVPELPGLSKIVYPPTDVKIPSIDLSFQIKEGGNGWSSYPVNTSTIINAVSKVTGLNTKYITNVQLAGSRKGHRKLNSQFYFYYNITVPSKNDTTSQNQLYTTIVSFIVASVTNGTFTNYFKNISLPLNITSVTVSPYTLIYPEKSVMQSTTIVSNNTNTSNTSVFYIVFGTLLSFACVSTIAYFVYKKRNMKINAINFRDSIPNPIQKQIQLVPN